VFPQKLGQNYSQGITSAVATGGLLDVTSIVLPIGLCLGDAKTKPNPYFNSSSQAPFTDYGIRPAMLLAAQSCSECNPGKPDWAPDVNSAFALIDRGALADSVMPTGTVYVMRTSDMGRNLRSWTFSPLDLLDQALSPYVKASLVESNLLSDRDDVLYYVQGTANQKASGNSWVPGGIGDSLTSSAGVLPASGNQTPITWWIEQGAVGSYGTVSEPCDAVKKFPDPAIFIRHYTSGSTLVEAYWKSVEMPFQGNFIGDPLVAPYFPVAAPNVEQMKRKHVPVSKTRGSHR
jgi:hypothetical protein